MKLYDLLKNVADTKLDNFEVSRICWDNRGEIPENSLFVCIEGKNFDGHTAAPQMLEKGAGAVIVSRDLGLSRQIIVKDTREALALLSSNWFSNPEKSFKLVGVTGTNGKTTIATTLKRILDKRGVKAGLIGTCGVEIGSRTLHGERTTPEAFELFEIFRAMADENCQYVVMEVSSQGLEQKRVAGVEYEVGIFTNLTQDHLDVHGTMENYYQAKKTLFDICKTGIINIDDSYGKRLSEEIPCKTLTFSDRQNADFSACDIKLSASGCDYTLKNCGEAFDVRFGMPGEFNVSNSVAVLACCKALGIPLAEAVKTLETAGGVCGRAEVISEGTDFTVIRDYAHTPDAIEKILKAIRAVSTGRVVCLFGCGGNRDAKKRPLMAKAAAENSDFCVVTSDNPRNEEPEDIIKDILVGMEGQTTPYVTITDRKEAIEWAIRNAQKGDMIAVVGKGHEDYQILKGGVKIHFDEKEVVSEILGRIKNENRL